MTNAQIIKEFTEILNITEEVNTYQGWQRAGLQVKKGSKALFQTKIWMPRKKPSKAKYNAMTEEEKKAEDQKGDFYMVKASFFGLSQVEETKVS